MTTPLGPILSHWEAEGYQHAAALDSCAGAVVIGENPSTAAEVALGIARVQARRRRVAVADTVGELAPLEDLVPMDAPYGLIDSFFYGVSLNKIAYTVDPAKNLIIFPSGATPIDHEALLGSDRWAKLLDGFRAAEGLLLVVAPAESSALSSLIQVMDGVVLVGNVAAAPGTRVLAHARLPMTTPSPTPPTGATIRPPASTSIPPPAEPAEVVTAPAVQAPAPTVYSPPPPQPQEPDESSVPRRPSFHDWSGAAIVVDESENGFDGEEPVDAGELGHALDDRAPDEEPASLESRGERLGNTGKSEIVPPWARIEEVTAPSVPAISSAKSITFWVAIVFGAFIAAALLTWITTSMMSRSDGADLFSARADTTHPAAHVIAAPAPTALAPPAPAPASAPVVAPLDTTVAVAAAPAGNAAATPYAVVLADVSSVTGANGEIDQASRRGFPVVTFAPYTRPDGRQSYVVIAGASPDSAGADSLLRAVRAKHYRNAKAAHVVRLPYALLIQTGVAQDQASMFVRAYLSRGLPVYPLLQADGSASLYAGAFRGIEQAQPLVTSFKANGDKPIVMIRTGRPY
ncbi:MAG TPA: hypothetical protein VIM15_05685 [Gemmatimonadaceae bacterium]